MTTETDPANPLAHVSNVALADMTGDNDVVLKRAKARQDQLREEMDRRHLSSVEGARFTVTKDVKGEQRFDSAAAKAKMGKAWCAQFMKSNTRTTYTVTPKAPEELGIAA